MSQYLEHSSENGAASHAPLEVVHFTPWFVNVERTNDNESRRLSEVALGNRNFVGYVFADDVNVQFQLCRDRDHRRAVGNCTYVCFNSSLGMYRYVYVRYVCMYRYVVVD